MIVLFDMDGTLTPPRKEITSEVIFSLKELSRHTRIGIVSGSDYDYILQQCEKMFEDGNLDPEKVDILPCNGTKMYTWNTLKSCWDITHSTDMIKELSQKDYNYILQSCFAEQLQIAMCYSLPYTGTFFHYRDSMLNWCPIGRLAGDSERDAWISLDSEKSIREKIAKELDMSFAKKNIPVTVALGGSTSFDIYPVGWDKTYSLQHYPGQKAFFVGDRCEETGNDWHIFTKLEAHKRAWKTTGPEETIKIINKIISKLNQDKDNNYNLSEVGNGSL